LKTIKVLYIYLIFILISIKSKHKAAMFFMMIHFKRLCFFYFRFIFVLQTQQSIKHSLMFTYFLFGTLVLLKCSGSHSWCSTDWLDLGRLLSWNIDSKVWKLLYHICSCTYLNQIYTYSRGRDRACSLSVTCDRSGVMIDLWLSELTLTCSIYQ
jgi:hypothetical protein